MLTEPRIVERELQPYLAVRALVVIPFNAMIDEMIPAIDAWMAARGIAPAGALMFKYNVINMPELEIEIGYPVAEWIPGDDRVHSGILSDGRYATLSHFGPYDGMVAATGALLDWGAEQGLRWDMQPTPEGDWFASRFESYETDPTTERDADMWETRIVIKLADG